MNDTNDPSDDDLPPDAASYFLGLTDAPEQPDDAFQKEVLAWADGLLPLETGETQPPPASLWQSIAQQIETAPGIRTVDRGEGIWEEIGEGLRRKIVHTDAASGRISYFLELAEGARLPEHDHPGDEHCVVLEGTLKVGSREFGAGAYQFAKSGLPHPVITAQTPALVFIHGPI
ncbi:cupin domain-containing protein [Ruegeria sp. HKCCD8929]|uniref:cupin domain-containing protein n=1 Tax=Ruegeria sp. HKCCD8929 TaxID=2683006 RepID=UPI00148A0644|nr:cupin domain-containing protein [Ruegeria sp. HKCCD8929]